ncbi:MAG: serine/threonine-protein kinase [Chloroflexota bacterium]|nr:serine/threonine-protein kinase [Chloroflexota bacterium]
MVAGKQSDKLATRQIKGLSQLLRKPLSLDANIPLDVTVPSLPPEITPDEEQDLVTRQVQRLQKRQPVPAASPKKEEVSHSEGLLTVGTLLEKRYKILGVVGIGGMGAVYKAQDLRFASVTRFCAVKEMINTARDPEVREMIIRNFEREASILVTLSHPAIPAVYDNFTEGRRSYLVMEYIEGRNLEAVLADTPGFIPEARVVDWAIDICDVLTYLHNHEPHPVIFRDLKPSNIILDARDRIRLIDFGIAKIFRSGVKGTMVGTEGYSPPEQYRGSSEPRGDIYALGATIHHLLSKQDPRLEPPFSFHERPIHAKNPMVSRELVEILDKSLEYDINKRWGSTEELKRALLTLPSAQGRSPRRGSGQTESFPGGAIKPLWRFACEDEIRASVAVAAGRVFVPSYDHNVYALEADSGEFVWKYAAEHGIGTTPLAIEDMVIFGSTDSVVYAVEMRSGRLAWSVQLQGNIYSSPYADLGHVFIGSDDRSLYALHLASGRKSWSYQSEGRIRSQPLLAENMIFFSCEAGVVYAMKLNREIRWRFRARRSILASPILYEGLVFIGSLDWNFYGLDARSGWAAWQYRAGGPIVSTATVADDTVFFGSVDGYIYALDARAGRLVWRYQVGEQVTGSPVVHQGNLYIGGVNGVLYCLESSNGNLRWTYQMEGPITSTPVIMDEVLYLGSLDHYIYAISI